MLTTVAVGLGSNLAGPVAQVNRALGALAALPCVRMSAMSSLYRSPPMGPPDQPDYINAVALLRTSLEPEALLADLQAIELRQGRVREQVRWGARVLDLDILLWGERCIVSETLRVPHPGLQERAFVLYPLAEIDPALQVPGQGTVESLLTACPLAGLVRIGPAAPLPESQLGDK